MKSTSELLSEWLKLNTDNKLPQQHIIFLGSQIYATYDNYDDALYDFNMLKQDPKSKVLLLKNYWISNINFNDYDILEMKNEQQITVNLRYDTIGDVND